MITERRYYGVFSRIKAAFSRPGATSPASGDGRLAASGATVDISSAPTVCRARSARSTSRQNPHTTPEAPKSNSFKIWQTPFVFALLFIVYFILGLFGYGNDCDTFLMLKSGRRLWLEGVYQYSRPPGYLIPEMTIGASSLIGSHFLSNLISSVFGTAALYYFWCLLRKRFSNADALLITILVGLNPYFVIAASSTKDYVYSLFFGMLGIYKLNQNKAYFAAIAFALAISSRLSNGLIIGVIYAYFLCDLYRKNELREMTQVFLSGILAVSLSIMLYMPSYLAAGKTLNFLTYAIGDWSFFGHLTRFIYKNICLFGLIPFLLLAGMTFWNVAKKKVNRSLSPEIVAGVAIVLIHELLFFKVPLEIAYLLPLLFVGIPGFVLVVAATKRMLFVLLVFTIAYGFIINIDLLNIQYDESKNEAVGAKIGLILRPGVVTVDVRKREKSKETYINSIITKKTKVTK